jgi:serine/threonine protein kinase
MVHTGSMQAVRRNLKREAGEKLGGKYSLVRRLASGGMGEIWIAHNVLTEGDVALKILRADADEKMQAELRFRHEAKLGAMLAHRNIVRVFDLIEHGDELILVLELLRGESLYRHLSARGKLPAAEAAAIVLPLLSALEHAHETGVIHRDLKPANIFLAIDPDGLITPKLLDFGIAKLPMAGFQTLDGSVLGTPRYMSPEQIRSDPKIDGRSDLFTVGALVIEMLTGKAPFKAESASASLAAVLELELDPEIDPRLGLVIKRAMAKRAYERFATANEFAKALREAIPESDAALAAIMRREKPPPSRKSHSDLGDHAGQHRSENGDSPDSGTGPIATVLEPRPGARKRTFLIAGLVTSALVATGAMVATTRGLSAKAAAAPSPPPSATSIDRAAPTPIPVPPWTATPPPEPAPSAAPSARPGAKPYVPSKKKPVATTPGF